MTCPHQESQSKWQKAPPTHPQDASVAAGGDRSPHGARKAAELRAPETSREMLSIVRSVDLPGGLPHPSRGALKEPTGGQGVPRQALYGVSCLCCAPNPSPLHLYVCSPHCSRLKGNRRVLFLETAPCLFVSFIHAMPPPWRDSSAPLLRETGIPATPTLAPRSERAARGLTREELRVTQGRPGDWKDHDVCVDKCT